MKWLCGILGLTFHLLASSLHAQISQPARYEREHRGRDHEFIIVSMAEKGLALIRDTEKYEEGNRIWEAVFLDTALQESWTTKIPIAQRMNILGHEYRDGNIYLIFQEPEGPGRSVDIAEILPGEQAVRTHLFKPVVSIHFTHFSVMKTKALFGGMINNKEPAIIMYDLKDETAKIIPGIVQPNVNLVDLQVNSNDTFNALTVEGRYGKARKMVIQTFDATGLMLVEDVIALEEGKSIVEARTSTLIRDELVIIGTWTYGANKEAAGIFSVLVDPFREQKVNYYDFAMLEHFFDYLKPRRAARIKAKAKWRRSVGKPVEFRTHLFAAKISESQEGFSFLGEVYDASYYNPRYSSPYGYGYSPTSYYSPFGYPYGFGPYPSRYYSPYYPNPNSSTQQITDVKMIDAVLVFFDSHGNLVYDQSLKFPEIKLGSKSQVSDFVSIGNQVTLACKDEEDIFVKIFEKGDTAANETKLKPELRNSNETIRSESQDNSSIRAWYGPYFYVYGYQTLRDNLKRESRDVFYINKVKVD